MRWARPSKQFFHADRWEVKTAVVAFFAFRFWHNGKTEKRHLLTFKPPRKIQKWGLFIPNAISGMSWPFPRHGPKRKLSPDRPRQPIQYPTSIFFDPASPFGAVPTPGGLVLMLVWSALPNLFGRHFCSDPGPGPVVGIEIGDWRPVQPIWNPEREISVPLFRRPGFHGLPQPR